MMPIQHFPQARFLTSVAELSQLPPDDGIEIAFAGRSNAGKSSALNRITQVKGLARTSKTPGRTQMINFFQLGEQQYLVDLPGYGFAKVPEAMRLHWQKTLGNYLEQRRSLKGMFLLMDIRHPLQPLDRTLLDWVCFQKIPTHILLTKADKLKRGGQKSTYLQVKQMLMGYGRGVTVQLFSALHGLGVEAAQNKMREWFQEEGEEHSEEFGHKEPYEAE